MIPSLVMFDMDNTLVESKQPLAVSMAILLTALMRKAKVAVISGGKLELFMRNLVGKLPSDAGFDNLYLLPTSGAALYEYSLGEWIPVYEERLTEDNALQVRDALMEGAEATGLIDFKSPAFGERIEYRGSQVSLSALGQEAPIDLKKAWDPGNTKRPQLRDSIAPLLPGFDVKIGGLTTIDVTKRGINKAFGVRKLSDHLHIPIPDMLYIGDALFPGGNDEVVKETGIRTQAVKDPSDTMRIIEGLLA